MGEEVFVDTQRVQVQGCSFIENGIKRKDVTDQRLLRELQL